MKREFYCVNKKKTKNKTTLKNKNTLTTSNYIN